MVIFHCYVSSSEGKRIFCGWRWTEGVLNQCWLRRRVAAANMLGMWQSHVQLAGSSQVVFCGKPHHEHPTDVVGTWCCTISHQSHHIKYREILHLDVERQFGRWLDFRGFTGLPVILQSRNRRNGATGASTNQWLNQSTTKTTKSTNLNQ